MPYFVCFIAKLLLLSTPFTQTWFSVFLSAFASIVFDADSHMTLLLWTIVGIALQDWTLSSCCCCMANAPVRPPGYVFLFTSPFLLAAAVKCAAAHCCLFMLSVRRLRRLRTSVSCNRTNTARWLCCCCWLEGFSPYFCLLAVPFSLVQLFFDVLISISSAVLGSDHNGNRRGHRRRMWRCSVCKWANMRGKGWGATMGFHQSVCNV